jgi:hypothetical protein
MAFGATMRARSSATSAQPTRPFTCDNRRLVAKRHQRSQSGVSREAAEVNLMQTCQQRRMLDGQTRVGALQRLFQTSSTHGVDCHIPACYRPR